MRIVHQDPNASIEVLQHFAKLQASNHVVLVVLHIDGNEAWTQSAHKRVDSALLAVQQTIQERLDSIDDEEDEYTVPAWSKCSTFLSAIDPDSIYLEDVIGIAGFQLKLVPLFDAPEPVQPATCSLTDAIEFMRAAWKRGTVQVTIDGARWEVR